jgi:hypothetical protein
MKIRELSNLLDIVGNELGKRHRRRDARYLLRIAEYYERLQGEYMRRTGHFYKPSDRKV